MGGGVAKFMDLYPDLFGCSLWILIFFFQCAPADVRILSAVKKLYFINHVWSGVYQFINHKNDRKPY